jgi:hypothetical protein
MVYDALGTMLLNIGMFGGSLAFAIAGIIFGITRGMTKNNEMWAITFSAFAWLIALMIPNVPWAIGIFVMGAIGITISFMPLLKKMGDTNIFTMAIISVIINLLLVFGSGAFTYSLDWNSNIGGIQDDIAELLGEETTALDSNAPSNGLCRPDDSTCSSGALAGAFNPLIFDVFASVLTIGDYISKAIKFAGMVIFAPFVIGSIIKPMISNIIIFYLIAILISIWNLSILYKVIAFILNKRGMT